ncbi:MAG: hypothetical protein AUH09_04255 [Candidatus Rokubacteria bacterium 13_2_20CM_70_12]|nr:MAG: hypothetical protein AUH09_04255 [Candidatus Rokubacteria bacterium 13_2_20CM_70_12]
MSDRAALRLIGAVSLGVVALVGYLLLGHRPDAGLAPGVAALPLLNACLNATSAALLTAGFLLIRRKRVTAHRACMVTALAVSILFLVSYVTYHALAGSRLVLAAVIVPLALTTAYRALSGNFARHVRIARWTLPLWLYVSVTGVLVYWMLYHL